MRRTSVLALILLRRDEFEFVAGGEDGVLVDEVPVTVIRVHEGEAEPM